MRTTDLDPDFRRTPKTDVFCHVCQRDIKGSPCSVYVEDGGHSAVHPDDIDDSCYKVHIGPECKKKVPPEYLLPEKQPSVSDTGEKT